MKEALFASVGEPLDPVFKFKLFLEINCPALNEFWQRTNNSYVISLIVMKPKMSLKAKTFQAVHESLYPCYINNCNG